MFVFICETQLETNLKCLIQKPRNIFGAQPEIATQSFQSHTVICLGLKGWQYYHSYKNLSNRHSIR
jgi:hypothetical protein